MDIAQRILEAINNSDKPLTTENLEEMLGVKRRSIYYHTHFLVKFGHIKRYMGLPGVFVSVEKGEA